MFNRKPAVEGTFYPGNLNDVTEMINSFEDKILLNQNDLKRPRILISPHAGLFFSGLTAAHGYKLASNFEYDRIVIFAPSHKVYFDGMSGALFDNYLINGKKIPVDKEFTDRISEIFHLNFYKEAHLEEHSAEIQLPFIYNYFRGIKISIFVYADYNPKKLSEIIDHILKEYKKALIIISSDLSHFHSYENCIKIDTELIEGIKTFDDERISTGEACGMTGIRAAVKSVKKFGLKPEILDYRNSGDIIPDKTSVVGYTSINFN